MHKMNAMQLVIIALVAQLQALTNIRPEWIKPDPPVVEVDTDEKRSRRKRMYL